MLQAIVEGTPDPEVLAELARGRLRVKVAALKEALAGRFGPHHALIVGAILSQLEFLEEVISRLSEETDEVIVRFGPGGAAQDHPGVGPVLR
jgi:transposase